MVCESLTVSEAFQNDLPRVLSRLSAKSDLFTQETEVRVVAEKSEHDEVGIQTVKTVPGVWVATHQPGSERRDSLVRLSLGQADKLLDLVFSFSGNIVATQDDRDIPPLCVLRYTLGDIVF